jgi:predicted transcriptional regulator
MAELTRIEQEVVKAMTALGATKDSGAKSSAEIVKRSNRPKGLVANALASLARKKAVQRVARDKSATYYLSKA